MVNQQYTSRVSDEDVIRGNSAILKCAIPAFVGDFVQVENWYQDDEPIPKMDKFGTRGQ